jgi:hypothetical protein
MRSGSFAPATGGQSRGVPLKRIARLVAVVGAVALGWLLLGRGPKDVVLVYDLGVRDATALEVALRRGGEVVRRAELRPDREGRVRHALRLPEGEYVLAWRVATPAGPRQGERPLDVRESGTIVLPIGR